MLRLQENRQNAWWTSSSVRSVEKQNNRALYSSGTHSWFIMVPRTTRQRPPIGRMSCMTKSFLKSTSLHSSSSTFSMIHSTPLQKQKGHWEIKALNNEWLHIPGHGLIQSSFDPTVTPLKAKEWSPLPLKSVKEIMAKLLTDANQYGCVVSIENSKREHGKTSKENFCYVYTLHSYRGISLMVRRKPLRWSLFHFSR